MSETRDDKRNLPATPAQNDKSNVPATSTSNYPAHPTRGTERRIEMAETHQDPIRDLIRLIPPARALKDDLEKSLHLEFYAGTGNMAVRSFQGLLASVSSITGDPYVDALSLEVPENATDKEKVSLALLAAGQLVAYLEGQTGLAGMGGSGNEYHLAPHQIVLGGTFEGNSAEMALTKVLGAAGVKVKGKEEEQEEQEEEAEE